MKAGELSELEQTVRRLAVAGLEEIENEITDVGRSSRQPGGRESTMKRFPEGKRS